MDGYDRISDMPNEILFHIISSLPFESAIQTIFLSKRWFSLWDSALFLQGTFKQIADSLYSFVSNFNPYTNTRKFRFHFTDGDDTTNLVAIVAPNDKLHLHFSSLPANQLFNLHLEFNPKNSPSTTLFITSLHLKNVTCLTNEAASSILTKFQFLESLKISNCNCLQSLSIRSDRKLQSLTIFDCLKLEFVHIRCFKLQTFRYKGIMPSICPEYHYNLVDAFLDFRLGRIDNSLIDRCNFDLVLLTIKNVRVLTLCKWTFQELIRGSLSRFNAEFQFYKVKEVWWIDDEYDGGALFSFLKLCPSLETLFVTIDPESYGAEKAKISSWCKCIEGGRNMKLSNLKVIKLYGFGNPNDEIQLAEGLGEVVSSEPIIFSSSHGICLKKMILPNSHSFYTHVEFDFEDANDLYYTKHQHMSL